MRTAVLLLVVLTASVCHGDPPPATETPAAALEKVKKEVYADRIVHQELAPLFLEHARKYPDDPSAVEALLLAVSSSPDTSKTYKEATEKLEKHYARSPIVVPLLRNLGMAGQEYQTTFLHQIGETNPDKRIRALAWRAIVNGHAGKAAELEASLARLGKNVPDGLKWMEPEAARLKKEVWQRGAKLAAEIKAGALPDVSLGAKAPATEAVDLDGKRVELADLRGKVVVLDFWFTRCGPCKKMIPTTNALIAELKGKPFAQVGVSIDETRATVSTFLEKTDMPWTHWWVGPEGKPLETWDVEAYPTVYVIDHEGIIRHRQVGFDGEKDKLHDVVRDLVKKAEAAQKKK